MANKNNDRESKREKFRSFENWSQWADLTQVMFKEKEIWDIIDRSCIDPTTTIQIQKKDKNNAITSKIIK